MIKQGLKSNGAACEGEGYISMTGGRAAPTGPTGRLKNNNNTTVPPPPMGAGAGQCTRPTNKQTTRAAPTHASSTTHKNQTHTQARPHKIQNFIHLIH